MLKVRIEKEPEKDWTQQLRETIEAQPITKEELIKKLKSENDVWYFDSDEEFEKFALDTSGKDWMRHTTEKYTYAYEYAVSSDKVFVVMGGGDESKVNRRRCVGHQPVQNLGEAFAHYYDITFDGRNLCPEGLFNHREALAVIKEKWEEVCGEYDGPKECYSKWVKTSIRPLIDAVKENYDLCDRLIIKEYCSVILLD
ncbi:MAG: hypothetical protein J6J25_03200 [Bacteroidales bacterium]|nr:hypothetical protein [Bacteroidales bacterium]